MTGRGRGFCIFRVDDETPSNAVGFAGIDGKRMRMSTSETKEVIKMPGGDGTGPTGAGAMTGRAAGYCAGNPTPGYANPVPERGRAGGWGRGRGGGWGPWAGRGRWFHVTGVPRWARAHWGLPARGGYPYSVAPTREQALGVLKEEAQYMEDALADIKKRVEELEAEKDEV